MILDGFMDPRCSSPMGFEFIVWNARADFWRVLEVLV